MEWDDYAATWDEDEAVRLYADNAFASLRTQLEASQRALAGARVWDFGCGTGLLSVRLAEAGAQVLATDASTAMVEVLDRKIRGGVQGVRTRVGGADDVEEPFDLIVCSSVCAFLDDYPGTVKVFAERLAPDGWLVQWDWALNPDAEEPFGLTVDQIRAAHEGAGLEVLRADVGFHAAIGDKTMAPLMGVGRRPG